ncbi:MAG: hypothetical protein V1824_04265 [archaeon]
MFSLVSNANNLDAFKTILGPVFGLFAGFIIFAIIVSIIIYIYITIVGYTIAKKLGYNKPWLAFIPFANYFLFPILADLNWAFGFIVLASFIPKIGSIVALVFAIICSWKIFEKRGYAPALSLLLVIPIVNLIMLGIVAWYDNK